MPLTPPLISALTAGILIIMQMLLAIAVILARRRGRQSLGDGGQADLLTAIRRHGNFAENAAIFIAGFALLEILGGGGGAFEIMCGAFVLGRISHAIGLSMKNTVNPFRVVGIALTIAVGFTLAERLIRVAMAHLS